MLVFCQNNLVGIFHELHKATAGLQVGRRRRRRGGGVVDGCEEG